MLSFRKEDKVCPKVSFTQRFHCISLKGSHYLLNKESCYPQLTFFSHVNRLNDVSIHWNSVCQLLSETLDTLAAVYKKLTLINEISMNEQDWLNEMTIAMANKRTTHGVIDIVKEEIELFNVSTIWP